MWAHAGRMTPTACAPQDPSHAGCLSREEPLVVWEASSPRLLWRAEPRLSVGGKRREGSAGILTGTSNASEEACAEMSSE